MSPTLERPEDDPSVRVPTARLAEAQQALAEALSRHALLPTREKGTASVDLDVLEDTRRLKHARADLAQAEHLHRVALEMAATRYRTARQPGRLACLRTLRDAATAAKAAAIALQDYDHETAATLGLAPRLPPLPALLSLDDALVRLQREIAPPPPAPASPPRPGYVRVTVRSRFLDLAGGWHYPDFAGQPCGPEDLPAPDAAEALRQGWVVEAVEA